jgi:Uma2 family endonuclease
MATTTTTQPIESLADLLERLGGIAPERIVLKPPPGKATEKDLLRMHLRTDRLFELIDGTLVEKVMGCGEGFLAADIIRLLGKFLDQHDLGDVGGPDATMRILPGMVRLPDVSFIRWEKLPNRQSPTEAIPELAPDLAIEVLSESNTPGEMLRKRKDYFLAGCSCVWLVDPRKRTVEVFTAPDQGLVFGEEQTLDGGDLLPGLNIPVREVFVRVPRQPATGKKPRPSGKRRQK